MLPMFATWLRLRRIGICLLQHHVPVRYICRGGCPDNVQLRRVARASRHASDLLSSAHNASPSASRTSHGRVLHESLPFSTSWTARRNSSTKDNAALSSAALSRPGMR
jgi:hypothetical protein